MSIFSRRRSSEPSKEEILAEARKATARARRSIRKARRYRRGRQANPNYEINTYAKSGGYLP